MIRKLTAKVLMVLILAINGFSYDYLVITHSSLSDPTGWETQLFENLSNRGFIPSFTNISNGTSTNTIKLIISYAKQYNPDLKYVLLVGAGTDIIDPAEYDYPIANSTANSSLNNFIPFYHFLDEPEWMDRVVDIPSDMQYVNTLDINVGRIPATSISDINTWLDKYDEYLDNMGTYDSFRRGFHFFVQDNYNLDNGCYSSYARLEVDTTIQRHLTANGINSTVHWMSDINSIQHCTITQDGEDEFSDALNSGAAFNVISGTGGNSNNLAAFFGNPSTSDYSLFDGAPGNFIFGNTCSLGKTNHPASDRDNVLKNMLFHEETGVLGFCAPSTLTSQHSTLLVYDLVFSAINNISNQSMASLFQALPDRFMDTDTLPFGPERARCWFSSELREFHMQGLIYYGDPAMPLTTYKPISGSISEDITLAGSWVVESDLTIASNATLTIKPGSALFFDSGCSMTVYGELIAEGTEAYPIVFSAANSNPSSSDWDGITLESGSDGSLLSYCKVEYAQTGVTIYESDVVIQNSWIENNYNGIYLEGILSPLIQNNKIISNDYYGVTCEWGGSPIFYDNTISENRYGVDFNGYTHARFGPTSGTGRGDNHLIENYYDGIRATYYSDPFLGSSNVYGRIGGYNSLYNNHRYQASASIGSDIEAKYCFWNSQHSDVSIGGGSSIDTYPRLGTYPGGGSSLSKAAGSTDTTDIDDDSRYADYDPLHPNPELLSNLWPWANDLEHVNKIEDAILVYKMLINRFPDTPEANLSLVRIFHLTRDFLSPGIQGYFRSKSNSRRLPESLRRISKDLLGMMHLRGRGYAESHTVFEEIIEDQRDTESEKMALTKLANLYLNMDNYDMDRGRGYLNVLKRRYPGELSTIMTQIRFGEEVQVSSLSKKSDDYSVPDSEELLLPVSFALNQNYPNPFNPVTTISYELPKEVNISLIIYDISGKEVLTLYRGHKSAGYYDVQWDGLDGSGLKVSTGIYLCRFEAGEYGKTIKMLYLK